VIVTGSGNSTRHQRFMREKFFKNEISENISQKFHTSEGFSTVIYVKFKGAS